MTRAARRLRPRPRPAAPTLLLFNKPYGVLCQFTAHPGRAILAEFVGVAGVYPAGRLDADSEGLVALTDDGALQARISSPGHKLAKTYWVQVEGVPAPNALSRLATGVDLDGRATLPALASAIPDPALWPREPPIRVRAAIPATWIEIVLNEGRNRQVRRMCAAVGHPVLRLVRVAIGPWRIDGLAPGQWRRVDAREPGGPVV